MRDEVEIRGRLAAIEDGIKYWKQEVAKSDREKRFAYQSYNREVLATLQYERKMLRWVLGEDIDLLPTS